MLINLLRKAHECMICCKEYMFKQNLNIEKSIENGFELYKDKPSKSRGGETWSKEDYADLGFVYNYLRFKSLQRYTEVFNMILRAHNVGIFDKIYDQTKVRFISIGGGPGFEMHAIQVFMRTYVPNVWVETTSQDLGENWEPFAKIMDCDFISGNFYDPELLELLGYEYDYAVMSYVVYHYMRDKPHILINLVKNCNLRGVFVNERFENLRICDYLEDHGILVIRLINQESGRDDRQLFLTTPDQQFFPTKNQIPVTYPNVPYEEHKKRKRL